MRDRLIPRDDISVLAVDIEQIRLVRTWMAIADAFANDDGTKAVLRRVHRAGADAAAGGTTDHHDGIDAKCRQRRRDAGSEEGAGILLADHDLARQRADLVANLGIRIAVD